MLLMSNSKHLVNSWTERLEKFWVNVNVEAIQWILEQLIKVGLVALLLTTAEP